MYRVHPQWQRTKELFKGAIGELHCSVGFSYFNHDAGNIRNRAIDGGAMLNLLLLCFFVALYL
jgi:hypothetical protein